MAPDFPESEPPGGADRYVAIATYMRPDLVESKLDSGPIGKKDSISIIIIITYFFKKIKPIGS
jgi:hypothetical protein